ncbi:calcium-binding and coiled-coil domain-containing protein 2 isoform X1 [Pungitius pungitius]|uniref:calcium-binding and coiled-coil domain-containing protein 2 isoform X1 n=1 Tax=Pungitius pungitius TaxID=134920 RepID=UPI002E11C673
MENQGEAAGAATFPQVAFIDTPYSYPPSNPVTCRYTLTTAFQPTPRDWVGIFKVGWSTIKDYHTFVWVEPCHDVVGQESTMRPVVFKEYYLPKNEHDFYQFCYVDGNGVVRGASTSFCFKKPAEEEDPESGLQEDLLVITTQEQVDLGLLQKAELQRDLDQMKEENETLKKVQQTEQQQVASLKRQNEQKEREMSALIKEMQEIKEQNDSLRSSVEQKEEKDDSLKEDSMKPRLNATQEKSTCSSLDGATGQNETHPRERYERAVMKINQLKAERAQLRGEVEAQRAEVATLNSKQREQERELIQMKDTIQLLQVDLQSSEKDKGRLSAELQRSQSQTAAMDDMKREIQELSRKLARQTTPQNCSPEDLTAQCHTLACQLQEAEGKLRAEREETRAVRIRSEHLDQELQQLRDQMALLASSAEKAERMSGKQELKLKEATGAIADARSAIAEKDGLIEEKEQQIALVGLEKEELSRENQMLRDDMERLRGAYAELQTSAQTDAPQPQQPQLPQQPEHPYEIIEAGADAEEEQSLVCRHCRECFPCITQNELQQHEQSHRLCPFCTMICDSMEQSAYEDHVYSHGL